MSCFVWAFGHFCGNVRGSDKSDVPNFMYCCVLVVGHLSGCVRGSAGCGVLN